jgi:glycosyltransferase involved in cell wall biosynthesis
MKFAIITHVSHLKEGNQYSAYAPYVREMNIWLQYVDEVIIVAPLDNGKKTPIDLEYSHSNIVFKAVPKFDFLNLKSIFGTLIKLPKISTEIYKAMKNSDHIHLRCPGNMGLLGCFIQILFPKKTKTAKYAGNWDPKARKPFSYSLQKWILSNTFLTKNMQVLVYGEWENNTKNIKPFFTASYLEKDKTPIEPKELGTTISFVFVGTLSNGKQPLYAIQLVEQFHLNGKDVKLTLFGEGSERKMLEKYCAEHALEKIVFLKGNQNQEIIKKAYIENHFVVLPSLSEGWPKALAEGMFWGCLPIATRVSCVPGMLGDGNRGLLLDMHLQNDIEHIILLLNNNDLYKTKVNSAINWSRKYTLDLFEKEIKRLLQS